MKKYRVVFGCTDTQKKKYFLGGVGGTTKTIRAYSDDQAEFLARTMEPPEMWGWLKGDKDRREIISLVVKHMYEITDRKVF